MTAQFGLQFRPRCWKRLDVVSSPKPLQHLIELRKQSQKKFATSLGMQSLNRKEAPSGVVQAGLNSSTQAFADGLPNGDGIALPKRDCR